jgi:hypothetical protein
VLINRSGTNGEIDRISNSAMSEIQVSTGWFTYLSHLYGLFIVLPLSNAPHCHSIYGGFIISVFIIVLLLLFTVFFTFTHS